MKANTYMKRVFLVKEMLERLLVEASASAEGRVQSIRSIHKTFPLWTGKKGSSLVLHLNGNGGIYVGFAHVRDVGFHGCDLNGKWDGGWRDDGDVKSPNCMGGKDLGQLLREEEHVRGKIAGILAGVLD